MVLKYFVFIVIVSCFLSCQSSKDKQKTTINKSVQLGNVPKDVDSQFIIFIEYFSKDSLFQLSRTVFPLKVKQYDILSDKDTIIYINTSAFEMMDFRINKSKEKYDNYEQKILAEAGKTEASIQVRGIENGISVDYYFEKQQGKWMLVSIDDAST